MRYDADAACRRSRDQLAAGVVVRLLDYLAGRPHVRGGKPCLLALPDDADRPELARRVADARAWPLVHADDRTSPMAVARLTARAVGADPTGTQAQVVWQLHRAFAERAAPTVVLLAGTRPLAGCGPLLWSLAGHPDCTIAALTDDRTARRLARRWGRHCLSVPLLTARHVERAQRTIQWLRQREIRRRSAALM